MVAWGGASSEVKIYKPPSDRHSVPESLRGVLDSRPTFHCPDSSTSQEFVHAIHAMCRQASAGSPCPCPCTFAPSPSRCHKKSRPCPGKGTALTIEYPPCITIHDNHRILTHGQSRTPISTFSIMPVSHRSTNPQLLHAQKLPPLCSDRPRVPTRDVRAQTTTTPHNPAPASPFPHP